MRAVVDDQIVCEFHSMAEPSKKSFLSIVKFQTFEKSEFDLSIDESVVFSIVLSHVIYHFIPFNRRHMKLSLPSSNQRQRNIQFSIHTLVYISLINIYFDQSLVFLPSYFLSNISMKDHNSLDMKQRMCQCA